MKIRQFVFSLVAVCTLGACGTQSLDGLWILKANTEGNAEAYFSLRGDIYTPGEELSRSASSRCQYRFALESDKFLIKNSDAPASRCTSRDESYDFTQVSKTEITLTKDGRSYTYNRIDPDAELGSQSGEDLKSLLDGRAVTFTERLAPPAGSFHASTYFVNGAISNTSPGEGVAHCRLSWPSYPNPIEAGSVAYIRFVYLYASSPNSITFSFSGLGDSPTVQCTGGNTPVTGEQIKAAFGSYLNF